MLTSWTSRRLRRTCSAFGPAGLTGTSMFRNKIRYAVWRVVDPATEPCQLARDVTRSVAAPALTHVKGNDASWADIQAFNEVADEGVACRICFARLAPNPAELSAKVIKYERNLAGNIRDDGRGAIHEYNKKSTKMRSQSRLAGPVPKTGTLYVSAVALDSTASTSACDAPSGLRATLCPALGTRALCLAAGDLASATGRH